MAYKIRKLDHTADLKVEIIGDSQEDVVLGSIHALNDEMGVSLISEDLVTTDNKIVLDYLYFLDDPEGSLIALLNEYLYQVQEERIRPMSFECKWSKEILWVRIDGIRLTSGEPLATEIKAVTYHDILLERSEQDDGKWRFQWIVDL